MTDTLIHDLLGPLHMHFLSGQIAYRRYLSSGRRFLWARSLRRINVGARELLMRKGHLLPAELQTDAAALITHYDVWLTIWTAHRSQTNPTLDSIFAFENTHTYPKDSEQRLEALYRTLSIAVG